MIRPNANQEPNTLPCARLRLISAMGFQQTENVKHSQRVCGVFFHLVTQVEITTHHDTSIFQELKTIPKTIKYPYYYTHVMYLREPIILA